MVENIFSQGIELSVFNYAEAWESVGSLTTKFQMFLLIIYISVSMYVVLILINTLNDSQCHLQWHVTIQQRIVYRFMSGSNLTRLSFLLCSKVAPEWPIMMVKAKIPTVSMMPSPPPWCELQVNPPERNDSLDLCGIRHMYLTYCLIYQ